MTSRAPGSDPSAGRWWSVVALGYLVALAVLVLAPVAHALNRLTVRLYVIWLYDLDLPGDPTPETFGTALNVVLFVPAGFLLVRAAGWPRWRAALAGLLVSTLVELAQALLLPDRQASVGDVLANTAGTVLGVLLAGPRARPRSPDPASPPPSAP